MTQVGTYMYRSHESYGACGLGSDATDKLVRLCEKRGRAGGVFGAKITGGGCGGVVCVLTADTDDAERAVGEVCEEYGEAAVFVGSAEAVAFGHLSVVINPNVDGNDLNETYRSANARLFGVSLLPPAPRCPLPRHVLDALLVLSCRWWCSR